MITVGANGFNYEIKFDHESNQHWLIDDAIATRAETPAMCGVVDRKSNFTREGGDIIENRQQPTKTAYIEMMIMVDVQAFDTKFNGSEQDTKLFVYELGMTIFSIGFLSCTM